jgi:hypothetical protein
LVFLRRQAFPREHPDQVEETVLDVRAGAAACSPTLS